MAITELALIRLEEAPPARVKEGLLKAQQAQGDFSHHPVTFATQTEDPKLVYLAGGWETVETHTKDWIASEVNQELLSSLRGDIGVEFMFHVDIDPASTTAVFAAPVISIAKFSVEDGKKAEFEAAFNATSTHLGASTAPHKFAGGWRIDKAEDEEFVIFSGWNTAEDHKNFEASAQYKGLTATSKAVESKHARLQKWE